MKLDIPFLRCGNLKYYSQLENSITYVCNYDITNDKNKERNSFINN